MNVKYEVLFVLPRVSALNMGVRSLFPSHYHYELVPFSNTCSESVVKAMNKAHFSIIMVSAYRLWSVLCDVLLLLLVLLILLHVHVRVQAPGFIALWYGHWAL